MNNPLLNAMCCSLTNANEKMQLEVQNIDYNISFSHVELPGLYIQKEM